MNLLCPNCQKMLTVADQYAGQLMKCPMCNHTFTVPALPPPVTPPAAGPSSAPTPASGPGAYRLAPEPAPANPNAGPDLEEIPVDHVPDQPDHDRPERADQPAPPTGYTHTRSVRLRADVLQWVAPAALVLVFILTFFPWVGLYPAGNRVFSQSAWGAAFNGSSQDTVWNRELNFHPNEDDNARPGADGLMIFFLFVFIFVVLLPTVAIVAWPHVQPRFNLKQVPVVESLMPWRAALVGGLALLALLLLCVQGISGFSLHRAVARVVDQRTREDERVSKLFAQQELTPEEQQRINIVHDDWLARFNPHTATAFRLSILLLILAGLAAGLTFWLERRAQRPPPRADFSW